MQQFREVIDECGFMDLGFERSKYAWSKHFENGVSIWERLDRCLVNNSWFMKFGGSRVYHLSCNSSDHVPILISLLGLNPLTWNKKNFGLNKCGSQIQVVRRWLFRLGAVGVWSVLRVIY